MYMYITDKQGYTFVSISRRPRKGWMMSVFNKNTTKNLSENYAVDMKLGGDCPGRIEQNK